MRRLTYKRLNSEYSVSFSIANLINADSMIRNKLGQIEDIEDELGCPLDVVFKALKDKEIVVKHTYGLNEQIEKFKTHKISGLQFNKIDFVFWLYEDIVTDLEFDVNVKDYKKTWWLKEDLSE